MIKRCPVLLKNGDAIVDTFDVPFRGDLEGTTRKWVPTNRVHLVATGDFDRVVWEGPAGCLEMVTTEGEAGAVVAIFEPTGEGAPFLPCK